MASTRQEGDLPAPYLDDPINFMEAAALPGTHTRKVARLARRGAPGRVFRGTLDCRVRLASQKRVEAFKESHIQPLK